MRNGHRLIACVPFVLVACATTTGGRDAQRSIVVESEPAGARVDLSSGASCTTPCRVDAVGSGYFEVTFSKPGCITQSQLVPPPAHWDAGAGTRPGAVKATLTCGG